MHDQRADPDPPAGGLPDRLRIGDDEAGVAHAEREIHRLNDELRQLRREGRTDARLIWATLLAIGLGLLCLAAVGLLWH